MKVFYITEETKEKMKARYKDTEISKEDLIEYIQKREIIPLSNPNR